MARESPPTYVELYKLEAEFHPGYVAHQSDRPEGLQMLGKWHKMELIRSGGYGTVYLETHETNNALRAAKRISHNTEGGANIGFRREIDALVAIKQNGMITSPPPLRVKLADFGSSKFTSDTELRTVIGTQLYMAPELLDICPRRGIYSSAIDIWSLGTILFKILYTEPPFLLLDDLDDFSTEISGVEHLAARTALHVDIFRLAQYCNGIISFPEQHFHERPGVAAVTIELLTLSLAPKAEERPSATMGLSLLGAQTIDACSNQPPDTVSRSSCFLSLPGGVIRCMFLSIGAEISLEAMSKLLKDFREYCPAFPIEKPFTTGFDWQLPIRAAAKGLTSTVYLLIAHLEAISELRLVVLLQAAIVGNHLSTVTFLLSIGAPVNSGMWKPWHKGQSLLIIAAERGNIAIVAALLSHGARVEEKTSENRGGRTPLQAAVYGGNIDIVRPFLEDLRKLNRTGQSPDIAPAPFFGLTAMQTAARQGNTDICRLLYASGCRVRKGLSHIGGSALQAAAGNGHFDTVLFLLSKGANVNDAPCAYSGRAALQAAAGIGHLEIVLELLRQGALVNAAPSKADGQTALIAAAKHGNVHLVELLLSKHADPNYMNEGYNAYLVAKRHGHQSIMKILEGLRPATPLSTLLAQPIDPHDYYWNRPLIYPYDHDWNRPLPSELDARPPTWALSPTPGSSSKARGSRWP